VYRPSELVVPFTGGRYLSHGDPRHESTFPTLVSRIPSQLPRLDSDEQSSDTHVVVLSNPGGESERAPRPGRIPKFEAEQDAGSRLALGRLNKHAWVASSARRPFTVSAPPQPQWG
jgi:hypothetical protein